ncbi:C39 family peptidase [Tumebacillus algifaecis]|nr:C39 family peptidase [Tumebacillus algifaecis]
MGHEIQGIPVINQYPVLPTGCEATALTMLLNWAGVDVLYTEVAKALPKVALPHEVDGKWYGGNPNKGFIGDPFQKESYGVFHGPIAELIERYLPGLAVDLSGGSLAEVLAVLDSGRPVVVWATLKLREGRVTDVWQDEDGTEIRWISPQHCMLMTGYDDQHVIINDPDTGAVEHYPRELFEDRWVLLGRQAVTVRA